MAYKKTAIGLCAAAVLAAGCGDTGQQDAVPEPERQSYADQPAELVIFGAVGNTPEVWNERFGEALKRKFPAYTFTYIQRSAEQTLQSLIASGQRIDLIHDSLGGMRGNVIDNGFHEDLEPLMKRHKVDTSRFEQAAFQALGDQGKLYGYPLHDGGLVMYYNKDIFDKFGVSYPVNGMTWDEAIQLGKRLTRFEDRAYIGLGVSVDHMLTMNPYSLPFVDASGKAAVQTEAYRKLVAKTIVEPVTVGGYRDVLASLKRTLNNNDFMKEKQVAMFVMNFYLHLQPDFETFNWGMVSLPTFSDLPGVGSQPYPNGLFLTSTSKAKDQGMEVLNFLVSDEFQMELSRKGFIPVVNSQPVRQAFAADTPFKDKAITEALYTNKQAAPMIRSTHEGLVSAPLRNRLLGVLLGEADLNTALRTVEEEANAALEAVRK